MLFWFDHSTAQLSWDYFTKIVKNFIGNTEPIIGIIITIPLNTVMSFLPKL